MTFLSLSPVLDPNDPAHALLLLQEEEALQAAINAMEPEAAARAIGQAPTIDTKSRLVWALAPDRRAEVLDHLHPGFVGALIQNQETENKALLGDLSREQFTRLLRYCSPERAPDRARDRLGYVLGRMQEDGVITIDQAKQAQALPAVAPAQRTMR